jgi:hypothetical protein
MLSSLQQMLSVLEGLVVVEQTVAVEGTVVVVAEETVAVERTVVVVVEEIVEKIAAVVGVPVAETVVEVLEVETVADDCLQIVGH